MESSYDPIFELCGEDWNIAFSTLLETKFENCNFLTLLNYDFDCVELGQYEWHGTEIWQSVSPNSSLSITNVNIGYDPHEHRAAPSRGEACCQPVIPEF